MKQISGNKLLVKALKEEGVEYVFGYPGACTIDISDELYKQDDVTVSWRMSCNKRSWCYQPCHRPCYSQLRQRSSGVLHRSGSTSSDWKRCIPGS